MAQSTARERQVLDLCLASLHALPDCRPEFTPAPEPETGGVLEMHGPWGCCRYRIVVVARMTPQTAELTAHRHRLDPPTIPQMIMTDSISSGNSETLRQEGIEYVDTAGNAFLCQPGLLVEISGRKKASRTPKAGRGFQPTGLRLIHLLLRKPEALNWTYRRLSKEAGLALGAVGPVLKELQQRNFAKADDKGRLHLCNRSELFHRWEIGYLERLRPKLLLDTCRPATDLSLTALPDLIVKQGLQGRLQVGGELGAALVLQDARPQRATLHIQDDPLALMLRLRLVPDVDGNISLLRTLDPHRLKDSTDARLTLADPLLLHAETAGGGSHADALAQQVYQRYLARHLSPRSQHHSQDAPHEPG